MQYLESQQRESEAAKEEAKRLRVKMKTYERYVFGVSVYVSTRGLNPGAYTHVYEHSNGVCVCVCDTAWTWYCRVRGQRWRP